MADDDDRVLADARIDEVQGIDKTEQSGLGGDSSVLEEYGEDTERDDLPEPEGPAFEPILPGSDKVITDLAELDAEEDDDGLDDLDTGVADGGREPGADRLGEGMADASGRSDDVAAQQGHMEEPTESVVDGETEGASLEDRGRFVGTQKGAQTEPAGEDVL